MARASARSLSCGLLAALTAVATCGPVGMPSAPTRGDLAAEVVRLRSPGPPDGPEGACWAADITPAVIETVTEQVVDAPELRDAQGTLVRAASFRTMTHQRMVEERREIWFRAPCPEAMDVDFIATLQRALKARGYYLLPLTGQMDAPTRSALRRFQSERGLNSEQLSLAAARELGIVVTELDPRKR